MLHSDVIKQLLESIIVYAGRNTSDGYIRLVLSTVLKKKEAEFPILKDIVVGNLVIVKSSIDSISGEELAKAMNSILEEIVPGEDKESKDDFRKQIAGYLGHAVSLHLHVLGVNIPESK